MSLSKEDFKKLLTKGNFKAYLEAHPSKTFLTEQTDRCAIAKFLRDETGFKDVQVDNSTINISPNVLADPWEYKTPNWVSKFIGEFDQLDGKEVENDGYVMYKKIPAKKALELFNELFKGVKTNG
jgi:hypothetical protein